MVWFKIDDGFWCHPKVLECSDAAVALWARGGSYCAAQLTDGKVTPKALRLLGNDRDAATELVMEGLWDLDSDGVWWFHDWAEYQPTREEVLKERAAAAERKRASRERSRKQSHGESRRDGHGTDAVIPASPTRPDPTRPDHLSSTPNGAEERVARALPPFCSKHMPDGPSGKACRACGDARLAMTAAQAAEKSRPTPLPRREATCADHPEWPLPCQKCADIAAEVA